MTDMFFLPTRRMVFLDDISISSTFAGILKGHPEFISQHIKEHLPGQFRSKYGEDVLILWPPDPILPRYRYLVGLSSGALPDEPRWRSAGVPATFPLGFQWDYSFMRFCWFQNHLKGDLLETISNAAKAIDWEKYARNTAD